MNLCELSRPNLRLLAIMLDALHMTTMKKLLIATLLTCFASGHVMAESQTEATIKNTNAEFVYKYLLGEIAGQRGDLSLASQLFLDLAKKTRDPRLAERATRSAAYARQQRLALDAATLWAELDPDSLEAQQASSQMLIATGDVQSAVPHLKKLLAREGMRANGFLHINDLLVNQHDKHAMYQVVKELAEPYPSSPEAQFALARAAWFAKDEEAAKLALITASSLRPGWELSAQMLGQIYAKESPEKAIEYFRDFLVTYPDAQQVRLNYAKYLVSIKHYAEAKPELIKLAENDIANADTTAVAGLLAYEANELAVAKKYLNQSLKNGFKDPEQLYIYLGHIAERNKNGQEAIEWYNRIPTNNQHYLQAQLSIADVIARKEGLDAAIANLNKLESLSVEQRRMIAQSQAGMLAQASRHQDAYDLLERTVNTLPNTPQLLYDYAMAAERIEKLDVMERELRKIIKLKPDYSAAYNALGYSFADRNINLQEAKALIETAHKLSPEDHYILDSLGWVEYRLGNYAVAAEHLRKAHSIQADPEISAHLGEVLWKQGLQEEAKKIWDTALKEHPENNILVGTSKKFNP